MATLEGNQIEKYRLKVLLSGLKLECDGFSKKGQSCYSIIKREFGLKGSKVKVLEQFRKIVEENE
jgi:hypothetical protein